MDPDGCSRLLILFILLLLTALFTAVDTALLSINKYRLRGLVSELDPKAVLVNKILHDFERVSDTINFGDSLLKIAIAVLGASLAFDYFGVTEGIYIAIAVLTAAVIVFAEILPRAAAYSNPERMSLFLVRLVPVILIVLFPLVKIFSLFKIFFSKLFGINIQEANGVTEEIIELVAAGQEEGIIPQEEKTMINRVFDFTDTMVRDLMVPRPDIVAVERSTSLPELMEIIKKEQFSRIPVFENSIDNILGVVHIKDLIMTDACEKNNFSLNDYLRPTIFLPETKKVNDLLKTMKKEKIHLGVVLDEYGGTAGIITMEDLIERIMGDIQDEHDTEEPDYRRIDEKTIEVNASVRIEDLNKKLGTDLECEEAETLGGIVFALLGRIPVEGDKVQLRNIELQVVLMEGHRIEKLHLLRLPQQQTEIEQK